MSLSPRAGIALALALATGFVYAQVRDHAFLHYDDDLYVVENPEVKRGLSSASIAWALGTDADGLHVPVTWLSYLVDAEVSGLSARGVLVANALYHTLSGVVLFLALSAATQAVGPSAFVAAVFLLHPIHAESVAWASERKDVLCALFWNLTLLAYVGYARRATPARYAAVLLAFALAIGSKPMAVTLPFVLLLLDYWPLRRLADDERIVVEKLPLFAVSGLWMVLTYRAQQADEVMRSFEVLSLSTRIGNACLSYLGYLGNAFWPANLSVFYPHRGAPGWEALLAGAVLLAATAAALVLARRAAYLAVGWLWFLGALVPVIGLVQVGEQAMANRYAYLPLVGAAIGLAWGLDALAARWGARKPLAVLAIAVALGMALAARTEVSHWRDGVALFEHALEADPGDPTARGNLGIELLHRGEVDAGVRELGTAFGLRAEDPATRRVVRDTLAQQADGALRQRRAWFAIALLRAALAIDPAAPGLHDRLARALFLQARFDEAFASFERAGVDDATAAQLRGRAAERLAADGDADAARQHLVGAIAAANRAIAVARAEGRQAQARELERQRDAWRRRASN